MEKADKVFSQYIRLRDRACRRCGLPVEFNSQGLPISHHNSHFMVRRKQATRYEELNCDTMCMDCHQYLENHPSEHRKWQVKNKGVDTVDNIVFMSNQYHKPDFDYEYKRWSEKIKELLV